jgi:hypothetical protein
LVRSVAVFMSAVAMAGQMTTPTHTQIQTFRIGSPFVLIQITSIAGDGSRGKVVNIGGLAYGSYA